MWCRPLCRSGHQALSEYIPGDCIILCVIALFIYGIGKKIEYKMQDELAERRKAYTANKQLKTNHNEKQILMPAAAATLIVSLIMR